MESSFFPAKSHSLLIEHGLRLSFLVVTTWLINSFLLHGWLLCLLLCQHCVGFLNFSQCKPFSLVNDFMCVGSSSSRKKCWSFDLQ